tara:strand:- start:3411 stop:3842 length:432 start_codon:yes stop_codon:yes gene_type:complete
MASKKEIAAAKTKIDVKKEAFIKGMEGSFGNVSKAAGMAGVDRSTPYKWAEDDKDFYEALHSTRYLEMKKDAIEMKLGELALVDKHPSALIFLAKTLVKDRGYVEKQEIDHTTAGQPLNRSLDLSKLSNEELIAYKEMQKKMR